jgi:hypothetical protein
VADAAVSNADNTVTLKLSFLPNFDAEGEITDKGTNKKRFP